MPQERPIPLPPLPKLPIDALREDCGRVLAKNAPLLLEAPPGTGKSTRVPLWAMATLPGLVLLLEPRRIAARMLARHLASLLGCELGATVGLAMRQETARSAATRLLVVTEGVFTRLIREDQALEGVSCVLFDEFHERSLFSDTGLALALESRSVLRPDLRLGVLSATLDADSLLATVPGAHVLRAANPGFPVAEAYRPDPAPGLYSLDARLARLPAHMAAVIADCLGREQGSLLAFLPGAGEIRRTADLLAGRLPAGVDVFPLAGTLSRREQDLALAPSAPGRRKVVLATDVAETSLTIEGVRIVVDSGLQRRPRYDPATGRFRLAVQSIPLASARQRQGRAGRTEPGLCVKLWSRASEAGMPAFAAPEILEADLAGLALDLALWGSGPESLAFPTQPPRAALDEGRKLVQALGLADGEGRPTARGRKAASLGLHPRTACTLLEGARLGQVQEAALLCALLEEARPHQAGRGPADLAAEAQALARGSGEEARRLRALAASLAHRVPRSRAKDSLPRPASPGRLLLAGFADRLAMRLKDAVPDGRPGQGQQAVFLARTGQRILAPLASPLARADFILALEAGQRGGQGGYLELGAGCAVTRRDVEDMLGESMVSRRLVEADSQGRIQALEQRLLGAIVIEERPLPQLSPEEIQQALQDLVLREGLEILPLDEACRDFLSRCAFVRAQAAQAGQASEDWPDMSLEGLKKAADQWLPGLLHGKRRLADVTPRDLLQTWQALLPWPLPRELDRLAPKHWTAPSGRRHAISYRDGTPVVDVKLQECFGLAASPRLPQGVPVVLHLNAPSGRPLAVTRDLAFFWQEAYPQVRAEMRGRYPRHPWPEKPMEALPTALTKKRLEAMQKAEAKGPQENGARQAAKDKGTKDKATRKR